MSTPNHVMQDSAAELEQYFVAEYLRGKGHTLSSARALPPDEFKRLMTEASTFASTKMAEVEDTAEMVKKIRAR